MDPVYAAYNACSWCLLIPVEKKRTIIYIFKHFLLAPFFKNPFKVKRNYVALLCGSYLNLFSIQHLAIIEIYNR